MEGQTQIQGGIIKLPKVIVKCDWCEVEIEKHPCYVNKNNFCNSKCHGEWDRINSPRIKRDVINYKVCFKCKETKPVSEFNIIKIRDDGLIRYYPSCKSCKTENTKMLRYIKNNMSCKWYPPGIKKCSKCKQEKLYEEFSPQNTTKDGRSSRCKKCAIELAKEIRVKNPERVKEINKRSREKNKSKNKEIQRRYREENRETLIEKKRSWHLKNKKEQNEYSRKYYLENKEYMLIKNKKWRHENPERAKELRHMYRSRKYNAEGFHTDQEWKAILNLFGNKCIVCGSNAEMTEDHILPLSIGGSDDILNIQPLCKSCNSSKNVAYADYRPITDAFIISKMYFL